MCHVPGVLLFCWGFSPVCCSRDWQADCSWIYRGNCRLHDCDVLDLLQQLSLPLDLSCGKNPLLVAHAIADFLRNLKCSQTIIATRKHRDAQVVIPRCVVDPKELPMCSPPSTFPCSSIVVLSREGVSVAYLVGP